MTRGVSPSKRQIQKLRGRGLWLIDCFFAKLPFVNQPTDIEDRI